MTIYKKREDICRYPQPAGADVAAIMNIQREGDDLLFTSRQQKREYELAVHQLLQAKLPL